MSDVGGSPLGVADDAMGAELDERLVHEIAVEVVRAAGPAASVAALWLAQRDLADDVEARVRGIGAVSEQGGADVDVLVAVMPWRWRGVKQSVELQGRIVELHDDPAHIDLVRAASAARPGSVAVVVAGLGFLARPGTQTVARSLDDAGLVVEDVRRLPSRFFTPAASTPRVLIRMRRGTF